VGWSRRPPPRTTASRRTPPPICSRACGSPRTDFGQHRTSTGVSTALPNRPSIGRLGQGSCGAVFGRRRCSGEERSHRHGGGTHSWGRNYVAPPHVRLTCGFLRCADT
jgi:hypothetical protein